MKAGAQLLLSPAYNHRVSALERELFVRWPKLAAEVPCEPIAELPTPVKALKNLDPQRAFMKCDNLSHDIYGGNKTRKLEFIIPDLKRRPIRQVITLGGVGTNSGVAMAMICRKMRISCRIYLFDQEPSPAVAASLRLMTAFGAELVPAGNLLQAGTYYYVNRRRLDPGCYFLYAGCSNAASVFGYVNAMLELKKQIDAGLCPMPDKIVVPVGSCGTLAGLTLGCALLELPITVTGIRVAPAYVGPFDACTPALISSFMKQALAILAKAYPEYRRFALPQPILLEGYYGPGYGIPFPEATAAMALGSSAEGLELEQTYTGKAFAAFLQALKEPGGACLFWNTHNSADTRALQQQADTSRLSAALQKYLK